MERNTPSTAPATDDTAFPDEAAIDAMREDASEWLIQWSDGTERRTTLVGVAWYARAFDAAATVSPLPD